MDTSEFLIDFYASLSLLGLNNISEEKIINYFEESNEELIKDFPLVRIREYQDTVNALEALNIIKRRVFIKASVKNKLTKDVSVKILKLCSDEELVKVLSYALRFKEYVETNIYDETIDGEKTKTELSDEIKLIKGL